MKFLFKIFPYISNKYVFTTVLFLVWLIFFDSSNLATQYKLYKDLKKVNIEKDFYTQEIARDRRDLQELMTNMTNLEQYGREKYLMKKDDEDIFVIVRKNEEEIKSIKK